MIERVATLIRENILSMLAYDPDLDTLAEARKVNNGAGWTIEESAPLGNILRTEGVSLSDADLVAAHDLAVSQL